MITARGAIKPGNLTAAGWTDIGDTSTTLFTRTYLAYRYATGSDPANWTFTTPNATNTVAALTSYRGASPNGPIAAIASTTGSGTTHPFPVQSFSLLAL